MLEETPGIRVERQVDVLHYLEMLHDIVGYDELAGKVKKKLEGLRVAPYYGCMLLRPAKEMAFDDPEQPVNNLCVMSEVSGACAPAGRSLISASVLGLPAEDDAQLDRALRRQLEGWFGAQVAGLLDRHGVDARVRRFGISDRFVEQGSRATLLDNEGLSAARLAIAMVRPLREAGMRAH